MQIGELAKITGCKVVTIRFYESEGLLLPRRSASGYRLYDHKDVERLNFIMRCRQHGIALPDIKKLLLLADRKIQKCDFAHELVESLLGNVEEKLESLQKLKLELQALHNHQKEDCKGQCAILACLGNASGCVHFQPAARNEITHGVKN